LREFQDRRTIKEEEDNPLLVSAGLLWGEENIPKKGGSRRGGYVDHYHSGYLPLTLALG